MDGLNDTILELDVALRPILYRDNPSPRIAEARSKYQGLLSQLAPLRLQAEIDRVIFPQGEAKPDFEVLVERALDLAKDAGMSGHDLAKLFNDRARSGTVSRETKGEHSS